MTDHHACMGLPADYDLTGFPVAAGGHPMRDEHAGDGVCGTIVGLILSTPLWWSIAAGVHLMLP